MGSDFLAARQGDLLVHTSAIADFVSAVVKGAVYVAVTMGAVAVATAAVGITIGTGGTAGPVAVAAISGLIVMVVEGGFGDLINEISDGAGEAVDDMLAACGLKGPPDGTIITGSPDVTIKALPAARAAGKLPPAGELAKREAADAKADDDDDVALHIASTIFFTLFPVAGLVESAWDFLCHPLDSLQEMVAPVVAGASPHATPADEDKILCKKWHLIPPDRLFLAEGSRTVHINSQPACRNGDRSTCEAVISLIQSGSKVRIGGPAEVVRDIRSGKNPFARLAGDIAVAILTRKLFSRGTKFRKTGKKRPKPCPCKGNSCSVGNPVHIPGGAKFQMEESDLDFALAGRIPVLWQRLYDSRNTQSGMLGRGWRLPFETSLFRTDTPDLTTPPQGDVTENGPEQFFYVDEAGRVLKLGGLTPGDSAFYVDEGFRVWRSKQDYFLIQTLAGEYSCFIPDPRRPGHWRLEKIMDRHQNSLTLVYDATGTLTHLHDDDHLLVLRLRHENGRLCEVWQQSENNSHERLLVSYSFTPDGQLAGVTDAGGNVTLRCEYGRPHGLMQAMYYPGGRESHYRWQHFAAWTDEAGDARPAHWRVVEHWIQDGATDTRPAVRLEHYRFDYDVPGQRLRLIRDGQGESFWRWDALEQITEQTDEQGAVWKNVWNSARQLLSHTDPLGHTETYSYDDYGNVAVYTDALGQKTAISWLPGFSFPTKWIQPGQAVRAYDYNLAGDVIRITDPLDHVTRLVWDTDGNNTAVHDAAGNILRKRFNGRGQITEYRDCSDRLTRWRYDEWGRLTHEINAAGNITRYGWSETDRLTTLTRPDGCAMQFAWNVAGELLRQQGFGGNVTCFTRNARGQITQRTDPAGYALRFCYDAPGRLTHLYNEKGEAYRFEYDARGHLIRETALTGAEKCWQRDALGNPVQLTEIPADGGAPLVTRFEHDALGRLTARSTASRRTEYRYDMWQTTLREIGADGVTEVRFEYDKRGQLTAEHNHGGSYRFEHDAQGNLTAEHLPDGRTLRHLYYGSGHLLQTQLDSGQGRELIAEYERDALHREIRRSQGKLSQYRAYNICGQLTRQSSGLTAPELSQPLLDSRYHRDSRDNLRRLSCQYSRTMAMLREGAPQEDEYSYDERGQVVHSDQDGHSGSWQYDAAMNLLAPGGHPPRLPEAPANQVTQGGEYRYSWDGFGRLSRRENVRTGVKQRMRYDDSHRLREVEILNGREWRRVVFRYDALDRRTEKRAWRHGEEKPEITHFEWRGMRLCGERNERVPSAHTLYLYEEESWQPLARVDRYGGGNTPRQRVLYYHTLTNGSPQCVTDSEGEIVWRARLDMWGTARFEENHDIYSVHPGQNLRFAGQYLDRETGLHYNTFRYFLPESGRFSQPDPAGLAGGINLYAYGPNPLSWIDPLGLTTEYKSESPYHGRKPTYDPATHHDPSSPDFRGGGSKTTPLPPDAEEVYRRAVPADSEGRTWFGQNSEGEFYRFQGQNGQVHWNGREKSSRGLKVPQWIRNRFNQIAAKLKGSGGRCGSFTHR